MSIATRIAGGVEGLSGPSPSAKRYRRGTHRTDEPRATAARIEAMAGALGITRVANVTGLDYLGIPVVMVVRPTSRNLSVMQGKGLCEDSARASGLGEAIESFCAERIPRPDRLASLEAAASDPACLVPEHFVLRPPAPGAPVPWTDCADLIGGGTRALPAELIYADFSAPAPEGQGHFVVTTNGLASGNARDEAVLHALCEVIERDAVALWMLRRQHGRTAPALDPRGLSDDACLSLLASLENAGVAFGIWDITSDIGVPAYLCAIDDHDQTGYSIGRIVGSGCHPCAGVALCRAITEAAQARLTIIVGARDDIDLNFYAMMSVNALFERTLSTPAKGPGSVFEDRSFATDDIAEDLSRVLCRLDAAGVSAAFCAELACPVPHFSCVRVLAPELEGVSEKPWYRPGARARALAASLR